MEEWKPIEGYEGKYEVSNLGNVRSLNYNQTNQTKTLKFGNLRCYKLVVLSKDGNPKTFQVHRLVAIAFIDNPQNLPCVNHKDEDKTNNQITNLEWCTQQYNINYGTRNEKVRQKQTNNPNVKNMLGKLGKDNPNSKPINQYSKDGSFIRSWNSTMDVQRELGFHNQHISRCALGKRKTCGGYVWRYA